MKRDNVVALLLKIREAVAAKSIENWPGDIDADTFGSIFMFGIAVSIGRSNIRMSARDTNISIMFKVGHHSIESSYPIKNFISRQFCPVWKQWVLLHMEVRAKQKQNKDMISRRTAREQEQAFNNLYYSEFPDEIDNIILGDTDD